MLALSMLLCVAAAGANTPEGFVQSFLHAYLRKPQSAAHLTYAGSLGPYLSPRLRRILEDAAACQADWVRQQPEGSTDKPPFVDCCVFSSVPDGMPNAFSVESTERLPDGRVKIVVTFTRREPPGSYSWRDAVIVTGTPTRYRVDDFVYGNDPPTGPTLLSESFEGCLGPRWTGPR